MDIAGDCYFHGVSIHGANVWKNETLRIVIVSVNVNQSLNNQQQFITIATLPNNPVLLCGIAVHTTNGVSTNIIISSGAILKVSNSSATAISQPRCFAILKY